MADSIAKSTANSSEQSSEQKKLIKQPSVVFSTYELIEAIMLRMTTFDITVALRVCKYWREVLESSKALKEYLSRLQIASMRKTRPTQRYGKTHHLVVKGGRGRFVITLLDKVETTIYVPSAKAQKLRLLDQRYTRTVVHDMASDQARIEWHDADGNFVCRLDARGCGAFYDTLTQIYDFVSPPGYRPLASTRQGQHRVDHIQQLWMWARRR